MPAPSAFHCCSAPEEVFSCSFSRALRILIFLHHSQKIGSFQKEKPIFQELFERGSRLLYVLHIHRRTHKTKNQPKDNNKTQNKQEACKKSTHDSSLFLSGGSLKTADPIYFCIFV